MSNPLNLDEKNARNMEAIRNFTLLDDTFMTQVFSGNLPATQMLLRTVLQRDDMIVERSVTQLMLANLYGRSVRLDIYARDAAGKQYDIEVQGEDDAIGKLMHDFGCKDYRTMHNKDLASIVRHYKEEPEGVVKMCKIMQDIVDSEVSAAVIETRKEIALNLWDEGEHDLDLIARRTNLTADQVREAISLKTA